MINTKQPLLKVENLHVHFKTEDGIIKAVNGVNFELFSGETLAIVGESGSGKTVTALSTIRLLDENGWISEGKIRYKDIDVLALSDNQLRKIRGKEISMIFQEPMTALNPVFTIGDQIIESLELHLDMGKQEARN
ncbi:MAG: ATP-binding cassette domain-containing protein, partial [Defluviitoga tunisiensis]|nr:ATP-binding cassette domain-containing protein [Defluviitoga tunisiensis]